MVRHLGRGLVAVLVAAALGPWPGPVAAERGSAAAALAVAPPFQVPLMEGPGADPTVTYHDPDGPAGSAAGYWLMLYNKSQHANSIVVRKAASLAGLRTAPDRVIYNGTTPGHPTEMKCGLGLGGWFVPSGGRWYLFGWGDDCTGAEPNGDYHTQPFVLESSGSDPLGPYTFKDDLDWRVPAGAPAWGYANAPVRINGQLYMTLTYRNKLYMASMSNPWTLSSPWSVISEATTGTGWECAGGPTRCINEGASVVERGGKAFLVFSAGGFEHPDYCVGMLTASITANPLLQSSWTKSSGCVFKRNDTAEVWGPASMNLFTSPDGTETWAAYHVKTAPNSPPGVENRVLQARRVEWNADGTPNFGAPYANGTFVPAPSGEVTPFEGINTFEAEAGTLGGGAAVSSSSFASGGSYVSGISAGRSVSLPVGSLWTRGQRLFLHYSNQGSTAAVNVRVNGGAPTTVSLPGTGPETDPNNKKFPIGRYAIVDLGLSVGTSTVRIEGVSGAVNLDRVAVDYRLTAESPALASRGSANLDLFAAKPDGSVWTSTSTNGSWGAWAQTGTDAVPTGARLSVGAVSRKAEWLDLFAVGRNGTVYTKWWQASGPPGWRNWFSLGAPAPGTGSGGVAAVGRTVDDLDVFVVGADRQVWHKSWREPAVGGAGWGAWTGIGAPPYGVVGSPGAVALSSTQMVVFVTGADGVVWKNTQTSGAWSGWYPIGSPPGGAMSSPAASSHTESFLDVVVRGADGALWTCAFWCFHGPDWGSWALVPGSEGSTLDDRGFAVTSRRTEVQVDVVATRPDDQYWWSSRSAPPWPQPLVWAPWVFLGAP